jgi:hypothetical protein
MTPREISGGGNACKRPMTAGMVDFRLGAIRPRHRRAPFPRAAGTRFDVDHAITLLTQRPPRARYIRHIVSPGVITVLRKRSLRPSSLSFLLGVQGRQLAKCIGFEGMMSDNGR